MPGDGLHGGVDPGLVGDIEQQRADLSGPARLPGGGLERGAVAGPANPGVDVMAAGRQAHHGGPPDAR